MFGNTLSRFIPKFLLSAVFSDWPAAQIQVLRDFMVSGSCIEATLSMGNEEMHMIRELDVATLTENKHKMWMFLADRDDWVGDENKRIIIQAMADEPENIRIVHGRFGIPHAYCISVFVRNARPDLTLTAVNTGHSEVLADQCLEWLKDRHFHADSQHTS